MSRMPTQRLPCGHHVQHEDAQGACGLCPQTPSLAVAGIFMDRSLNDFVRACQVYIGEEQAKLAPDNALINLLADAIRLTHELTYIVLRTGEEAHG